MPEPNLPPLRVNIKTKEDNEDVISVPLIKEKIPELPEESRTKLITKYELRPEIAVQLVNEPVLLDFFKKITLVNTRNPTKVANLLLNDLLTVLNKKKIDVAYCPITVSYLEELVDLLLDKKISLDVCRKTINELVENGSSSPIDIIKQKGWLLTSDEEDITKYCVEVVENNPKLVKQYKEGKIKVFRALLGILSKSTNNKLDMSIASKKLEELLKK